MAKSISEYGEFPTAVGKEVRLMERGEQHKINETDEQQLKKEMSLEEKRFFEKALIDIRMLIERQLEVVARYFQFKFKELTYLGLPLSYNVNFGFDTQEDYEVVRLVCEVAIPRNVVERLGLIYKERFKDIKRRLRHLRKVDRYKYVGEEEEFSE